MNGKLMRRLVDGCVCALVDSFVNSAPIMVELDGETDPLQIAGKELREKKVFGFAFATALCVCSRSLAGANDHPAVFARRKL